MFDRPESIPVEQLLGRDSIILDESLGKPVHPGIVAPFRQLQARAAAAGFDLQIVSGFRSFDRQLAIWNAKASGQRVLLDSAGEALDFAALSDNQRINAIMRWSALPGASRHHWGCDIDVYDAAAVNDDYQVQLTPQEVTGNGPFAPLHNWLDGLIERGQSEGFFRPYSVDRGGIAPERWHLSYAPLAAGFQARLTPALLQQEINRADLTLKAEVVANLAVLFRRYVWVPATAYPSDYQDALQQLEKTWL